MHYTITAELGRAIAVVMVTFKSMGREEPIFGGRPQNNYWGDKGKR